MGTGFLAASGRQDGATAAGLAPARADIAVRGGGLEGWARAALDALTDADAPARWLVTQRWAILAVLALAVAGAHVVLPGLRAGPIAGLLGAGVLANLLWSAALRREAARTVATVESQILADAALGAGLLWFAGGLENPFSPLLVLPVVIAGVVATRRVVLETALVVLGAAVVLARAEPLPLVGARPDPALVANAASVTALAVLAAAASWVALVLARRRAEALQAQAWAAPGRAFAALAHELATPLNSLVFAGEEVAAQAGQATDPALARMAELVSREARRAGELSALMMGHVRANAPPKPVDAAALAREAASGEFDRLRFPGSRELPTGAFMVEAPEPALFHVVTSLVANAARAASQNAAAEVHVQVDRCGERVEIRVSDNGPGMAPAVLAHLGEPMRTGHAPRGGTGLGLYAAALLASRMGGRLRVESAPGRGTTAVLELPGTPARRSG